MPTPHISVLGAGSYGTALAITLAKNGHSTLLWGHEPALMADLAQTRRNDAFLPGIAFPEALSVTADLATAVRSTDILLVVVPSHVFGEVLARLKPFLHANSQIVWATKGLEAKTGRLLSEVAQTIVGSSIPLAVISGPTFAHELAAGLPTAIAIAATHPTLAQQMAQYLQSDALRVYQHQDLIGVQLGGAIKNVIAIGAGISDGLGFGANARTALITRGLAEMQRLGQALGAQPDTLMGMAGLGDLVLTCTDNQSRNRRFGLAIGQGESIDASIARIGQVVEGYRNSEEVHALTERIQVEMPICEQVYAILYQGKSPALAAQDLLQRKTFLL